MKYIDEAKIFVQSGAGGNGCSSFRREYYEPRGGPNGGDGGRGGSVILVTDISRYTLADLAYNPHYRAKRGQHGMGSDCHGKSAEDLIVKVPVGVVVYDAETGEQLADLDKPDMQWVAAKGGRGGRGNIHFMTNANKAPTEHEDGQPGENRWIRLDLKTLADVGLVGFPSTGKSTLIGAISAAHPRIASYHFTTLRPNLGTVDLDYERRFVVADIPGIIEGAHRGTGLGLRFLKHIERTRLLLHLVDLDPLSDRDPIMDFDILNLELAAYSEELAQRPQMVVANKTDVEGAAENLARLREEMDKRGIVVHAISAKEGIGIVELLEAVSDRLQQLAAASPAE